MCEGLPSSHGAFSSAKLLLSVMVAAPFVLATTTVAPPSDCGNFDPNYYFLSDICAAWGTAWSLQGSWLLLCPAGILSSSGVAKPSATCCTQVLEAPRISQPAPPPAASTTSGPVTHPPRLLPVPTRPPLRCPPQSRGGRDARMVVRPDALCPWAAHWLGLQLACENV